MPYKHLDRTSWWFTGAAVLAFVALMAAPTLLYPFVQPLFPDLSQDLWQHLWSLTISIVFVIAIVLSRTKYPHWKMLVGLIVFFQLFQIIPK
jgi:hypothetical protein